MAKYSIEKFVKDCKFLGWYDGKANPAWMDEMDLPVKEDDCEKVLMYKQSINKIPTIMDYWKLESDNGVHFIMEYMSRRVGQGFVLNTKDLITYMKVSGYNRGVLPRKK